MQYFNFQLMQKLAILPMAFKCMLRPGIGPEAQGLGTLPIVVTKRFKPLVDGVETVKPLFAIRKAFDDQKKAGVDDRHGVLEPFVQNRNGCVSPQVNSRISNAIG